MPIELQNNLHQILIRQKFNYKINDMKKNDSLELFIWVLVFLAFFGWVAYNVIKNGI